MAQVYENDVTKVGGNLQKTVAYLLSLHKAEYEWNMLGIKVIGHVDALPIPDGTYEYGDTYMVGTTTPYDMWIYTRADEFHATDYWFNVGKFPQPGQQGPKGDGLEQIQGFGDGPVQSVTYDTTHGAIANSHGFVDYTDSTTGANKHQEFDMEIRMPIVPGKYISMDTNTLNDALEVKVDDTKLSLDYYKINRNINKVVVPFWNGQNSSHTELTDSPSAYSAVQRNYDGNASFGTVGIDALSLKGNYNSYRVTLYQLLFACRSSDSEITVVKTTTDTGTLTTDTLSQLKIYPQIHIQYNNQTYYRMDPLNAPNGTLNFVHLDTVQSGGGYAARGKCFSITTSTRAWQVVDISFGPRTHQITITDNSTNAKTYMTIVSNRTQMYTADDLITDMGERSFPCTHDSVQNDTIYAGVISALSDTFTVRYSNNQEVNMTSAQVTITDYVV